MSAATDGESLLVHGTAVAVGGHAVLFRGPAGSGKSDLALRLIYAPPAGLKLPGPPRLIADDQCRLVREADRILIHPPATIAGLIEVRGHGLVRAPHMAGCPLRLVVDLVARDTLERLPERGAAERFLNVQVPLVRLHAFDSSCLIKVLLALADATATNYI